MRTKYKSFLKDTIIFAIGNIGSKLILFVMVPLYTNFLSNSEYGISELVFTVAQLLVPFLSLVIFDAVIRFGLSKKYESKDVLLVGMMIVLVGSIIAVIITPLIGLYGALSKWKWYVCIYIVFDMVSYVGNNYLKAVDKNKLYVSINLLKTFILASLNIILLAIFKMGITGYFVATLVASAISIVATFVAGGLLKDLKRAHFDYALMKQMISFSVPLIFNDISWWVVHSSDKMMIEVMVSSAALGLYAVASKIPSLINVIISIFSQAWRISAIKEVEGKSDTKFYSNIFTMYYIFVFGICILINSIIKPFMGIYVGDSFVNAWIYIPILIVSAVFSAVSSYFGVFYSALKKTMNSTRSTIIAAIINIVLNFILIKRIGVLGAVIATAASYIFLSVIRMGEINHFIKIKINYLCYFINALLIIIHAVGVMLELHIGISIVAFIIFCIINTPIVISVFKRKKV